MPFNFLPFQKLEENTINLVAAVRAKHEETKREITNPRKDQIELLDGLHAKLRKLSTLAYNGKLEYDYTDDFEQIEKQLPDLVKQCEESKVLVDNLQAEYEASSRQFQELKDVNDSEMLKLTEEQLRDASKESEEKLQKLNEAIKVLEKQHALKIKLQQNRETFLRLLVQSSIDKTKESEFSETRKLRMLNEEQRALIVTGAYLNIKKQIEIEYSTMLNKLLGKVTRNEPTNSVLYSGIDEAIGVTPENMLDPESEKRAIAAYNQFVGNINELNLHLDDNVKDEEISAHVNAKFHLNKVNDTAVKVEKPRYEDSINTTLLMPNPKMVAQAKDNKTPANTRKILSNLISQYTPKEEIGRYVRDEVSDLQYLYMNGYQVSLMSGMTPKFGEIFFRSADSGLQYVADENNDIKTISWDELPENFPKQFSSTDEISDYIPEILKITSERGHTMDGLSVREGLETFDQRKLRGVESPEEKPAPAVVREIKPEEHIPYEMTDKQYKTVKIPGKEPVKVLTGWNGGYKAEDKEKVKVGWKGVKDPVTEQDDLWKAFSLFNGQTKAKIEGFNNMFKKHVEPEVSTKVPVTEDYDAKARPSFK